MPAYLSASVTASSQGGASGGVYTAIFGAFSSGIASMLLLAISPRIPSPEPLREAVRLTQFAESFAFPNALLQHALNSTVFRVYVNADLVGVELCAAAKKPLALRITSPNQLFIQRLRPTEELVCGVDDRAVAGYVARGDHRCDAVRVAIYFPKVPEKLQAFQKGSWRYAARMRSHTRCS